MGRVWVENVGWVKGEIKGTWAREFEWKLGIGSGPELIEKCNCLLALWHYTYVVV